jgi:hypothetical protein
MMHLQVTLNSQATKLLKYYAQHSTSMGIMCKKYVIVHHLQQIVSKNKMIGNPFHDTLI